MRKKIGSYILERSIAKCDRGEVFVATSASSHKFFAIKMIKKEEESIRYTENELAVLQQLSHKNIVKVQDIKKSSKHFYIIFKLYDGGTLADHLKARGNKLEEGEVRAIAKQLADALNALYQLPATHRNLKLSKVFLHNKSKPSANSLAVKLGGFKHSQIENQANSLYEGDYLNVSPEVLYSRTYTRSSDIWSFGSMIYEMLTGHRLCGSLYKSAPHSNSEMAEYRFSVKGTPSMEAIRLILRATEWNWKQRISWEELVGDPFFAGGNVTEFAASKVPKQYCVKVTRKHVIITPKKECSLNSIDSAAPFASEIAPARSNEPGYNITAQEINENKAQHTSNHDSQRGEEGCEEKLENYNAEAKNEDLSNEKLNEKPRASPTEQREIKGAEEDTNEAKTPATPEEAPEDSSNAQEGDADDKEQGNSMSDESSNNNPFMALEEDENKRPELRPEEANIAAIKASPVINEASPHKLRACEDDEFEVINLSLSGEMERLSERPREDFAALLNEELHINDHYFL